VPCVCRVAPARLARFPATALAPRPAQCRCRAAATLSPNPAGARGRRSERMARTRRPHASRRRGGELDLRSAAHRPSSRAAQRRRGSAVREAHATCSVLGSYRAGRSNWGVMQHPRRLSSRRRRPSQLRLLKSAYSCREFRENDVNSVASAKKVAPDAASPPTFFAVWVPVPLAVARLGTLSSSRGKVPRCGTLSPGRRATTKIL